MFLDTRVKKNSISPIQTHFACFFKDTGKYVRGRDSVFHGDNNNETHSNETFITLI